MSLYNSNKKRPSICIVGPFSPPYRGGIAQYTARLATELSSFADVKSISFKTQYPRFLYPGQSDKISSNKKHGVQYSLSIYSPLSWYLAAKSLASNRPNAVIITWWTFVWAVPFALMSTYLKKKGVKVIFLCHNLFDHDDNGWKNKIIRATLGSAYGYIVHSKEEMNYLNNNYTKKPVLYRVHPIYDCLPISSHTQKKRGRLELLFFGFIRPYKGLDILIEALEKNNDKEVYLTIVGEAWGREKNRLDKIGKTNRNIELNLKYVDVYKQGAADYFARADAVVLPYRTATGSGVAALAYFYEKPIIATDVGGLADVVVPGKTGWLVSPGSSENLAYVINNIERQDTDATKDYIERFCAENNWQNMAKAIIRFVEDLNKK